jgi:hypothetical protein
MEADNKENKYDRDETRGRRAYVINLFCIFIALPLGAAILGNAINYDFSTFSQIVKFDENGQQIASGFRFNVLSVWYLSIPLFIWCTYRRVTDTSLNIWLTPIFLLPFVNLVIWFWPPKKQKT